MPASEQITAGSLVWRLTMKWRAAVERAVAPLGLTHAQYVLLASLSGLSRRGVRPSQRELADHTGLEPVYVSKLARALEQAGFVERATNPADPRAVQLRLTEPGADVVERAITVVRALQEVLAEPLGGTAGSRYRELIHLLRTLLDEPRPIEGNKDMAQPTILFGQALGMASTAARRLLIPVLNREGITFHEWIAMKTLNDAGAPVPRDGLRTRLVEGLDADAAVISAVLSGLESRNVLQETSGGLALTRDGQVLFDRLATSVSGLGAALLEGLPAEDVETTRRVLARFTERANGMRGQFESA